MKRTKMLKISNLSVNLGTRRVLENVNLSCKPGQLTALVGPNGAGKTTLLRCILGLERYQNGSIMLDQLPVRAQKNSSKIGYVPQRHSFDWDYPLNVFEVVLTAFTGKNPLRKPSAAQLANARQALIDTGLSKLASRQVGELSGGQRQRVLVARALAKDPQLLLLDEPFTGLDLVSADQLLGLFTRLASQGRIVLLITHDLLSAQSSCDTICLLNRTCIASGSPQELLATSAWQQTFGVAASHPLLQALGVKGDLDA